ncbi:MAG: flagellar basal body L-ring protein FlgH [Burkholderiales bacterium]|nr:flagellar basal body L-ring protein FlgH [Burkholderiales bacterium]
MKASRLAALACLEMTLVLSACGVMPTTAKVDVLQPSQARPVAVAQPPINTGSIFQSASYSPLYENHRARQVGDIVTVSIAEKITAKQESTSSVSKGGSVSGSISALPFMSASQLVKLDANGKSSNAFDGKGSTVNNNNFSGTITATVIEVLPNGHLVVSGEKQIGVNANADILRFSGQIDPATIQPGNVVSSTQVANVRIEQRGLGAQADAQGIGWLAHFFLSILPL